eukprot:g6978.t1
MELLTVDTVCDYVASQLGSHPEAPLDCSRLQAQEVTGGNLNYAFAVRDAKGHAVFVKQAPDFIKVIGPAAQLTRERMRLEVQVYQEWVDKGAEMSRYIPRIWKFDEEAMAFIMEFLGSSQLLQQSLFQGEAQETLAKSLGECMAIMHSRTGKLDAGGRARLAASYENRLLRDIQLEYVFSKCYREDPRAAMLREDSGFMTEVENLKAIYNGQNQENLSLCHGDLHAGSVMVDGAASSDSWQHRSPAFGLDGLGSWLISPEDLFSRELEEPPTIWEAYVEAMKAAGISSDLLGTIEVETLGFIGCEVARTALGLAFARSLRIEDCDPYGDRFDCCCFGARSGKPSIFQVVLQAVSLRWIASTTSRHQPMPALLALLERRVGSKVSGSCGELVMKMGNQEARSALPIAGSLRLEKGGLYLWTLQVVRQCDARPQIHFGIHGLGHAESSARPWRLVNISRCSRSRDDGPWMSRPAGDLYIAEGDFIHCEADFRGLQVPLGRFSFAVNDGPFELVFEDIPLVHGAMNPVVAMGGDGTMVRVCAT